MSESTSGMCPDLADLPPPPPGKSGWPWTVGRSGPSASSSGRDLLRVTVVTPSYNQGRFIEETIRSVLLQGYPNLEYIIIDGGSTDESVELIRKYQKWVTSWVSERDGGQADAINRGLRACTGEIFHWINSDDVLNRGAVHAVAAAMPGYDCVAGAVVDFDARGHRPPRWSRRLELQNFIRRPRGFLFHQPGVWMRTEGLRELGGFDPELHYKFDWELAIRYIERWPRVHYIDDVLVNFRLHPESKTVSQGNEFVREDLLVLEVLARRLATPHGIALYDRALRKRYWRGRVDELMSVAASSRRSALRQLCRETLSAPRERLDRYTLGAIRRLLVPI